MSSLFSIADNNFDDLEDQEFLIEACGFNFTEPKSNDIGTRATTGNDHILSKNKSNTLHGFGCTNSSDVSINSMALLRCSPANYDKNGKQHETSEPQQKRLISSIKDNNYSHTRHYYDEVRDSTLNGVKKQCNRLTNDNNNILHNKRLKSDNHDIAHLPSRTPPNNHRLSDGLRYTTSFPVPSSPNLNKEHNIQSASTKSTFKMSLPQSSCNDHFSTDLSSVSCLASPVNNVRRDSGYKTPQSGNRESPAKVNKSNEKCFTPKTGRRFPGPAGMLPRLEPGENLSNLPSPFAAETPKKKSPEICQMINNAESDEDFFTNPWALMQEQITKRFHTPLDSLASVIRKATSQQLDNGKVAFLGVLVKSFSPTGLDASVVLKDTSGEMRGTLHRKVLEEHQLEPGCGLFLKQVSVFSPSPRKHYLNITPGNIVEIFPISSKQLSSPGKVSQTTPKRQQSQIIREPDITTTVEQSAKNDNLCEAEDNFDDLLQGLDSDDDILVEAMCL